MGLLDFFSDPRQMALLGMAGGLLQAGGPSRTPVGLGQAVGSGLLQGAQLGQSTAQQQLVQAYLGQQIKQLQASNDRQAQLAPILQGFAGRLQGQPQQQGSYAPTGVSDASAASVGAPWAASSQLPQQAPQSQSNGLPFSLQDLALLKMVGGPDLTSAYTAGRPKIEMRDGVMFDQNSGNITGTVPQMNQQGFSTQLVQDGMGGWKVLETPGGGKAYGNQQLISQGASAAFGPPVRVEGSTRDSPPTLQSPYNFSVGQGAPDVLGLGRRGGPQPQGPTGVQPPTSRGVPAGMSESDKARLASESSATRAVDDAFSKEYVSWTTGGGADVAKQLGQLNDVAKELGNKGSNLTGPVIGRTPDAVLSVTNPKSIAMRERVEEVVQRSLRAILGAQFTEKEGERLIARAYNPTLGEAENKVRVERLFTQLNQAFESKQNAIQYFQQNGTLKGWKGKMFSMSDFDPEGGQRVTGKIIKWGDL